MCNFKQPFQEILTIIYKAYRRLMTLILERVKEKSFYHTMEQKENKDVVKVFHIHGKKKYLLIWWLPSHSGFPATFKSLSDFTVAVIFALLLHW